MATILSRVGRACWCLAAATTAANLRAIGEHGRHETAVGPVILGRLQSDRYLIPRLEAILAIARGIDRAGSLSFHNPLDVLAVLSL